MPTGAGKAPAGSSLAGYGVIDSAPPPGIVPLPDTRSGLPQTGRLINQQTGDYVFTADGRLEGMPTVNQLVLIAIRNNIDLSTLQEKGPNFANTLTSLVQNALSALITAKLVLLSSVTVLQPNPDAGVAIANWLDLTNGEPQQTQF